MISNSADRTSTEAEALILAYHTRFNASPAEISDSLNFQGLTDLGRQWEAERVQAILDGQGALWAATR
jgi:hypothetical protein